VFATRKPFQPNLIFTYEAGPYLSKAPFWCSTLG